MKQQRGGPLKPPHHQNVTLTDDPPSITERPFSTRVDHRQRQIQRLAAIAIVRAAYGTRADAGLVPPGPRTCPPGCRWCGERLAVVA